MDWYEEYEKARKQGEKAVRKARGEGRNPYLTSLAQVLPEYEALNRYPAGTMEIPLSMIAGTVTDARQNSFAWNFLPVFSGSTEFGSKWISLFQAQQEEGIHDPIRVYEFMNRFYVLEGNKRVSVLSYVGASTIRAQVERIMPKRNQNRENIVYYEFLDFFRVTGLYGITFTQKGSYESLAVHYGMNLQDVWPEDRVIDLRSDFGIFSRIFTKKGGANLALSAGDAYLMYLDVFKYHSLLDEGDAAVEKNISGIWNELMTVTSDEEIALVDGPEQGKKKSLLNIFVPSYSKKQPLKAAFIYTKNPGVSRWEYGHELGRNQVEDYFEGRVVTEVFTECNTEEKVDAAFDEAFKKGIEVVFTTAPHMMESAVRAAVRYPNMRVLNCSINMISNAVRCYYPRLYEAKYLMGFIAAGYAEDHRIGYVADYPLNGTIANINAFAIGASMVDPKIEISLKWSGVRDCDWREEFRKEGITLVSGPDFVQPDDASRRYGLYKTWHDGRVQNLAAPIIDWGKFYSMALTNIMDGKWEKRENAEKTQAVNYWFGFKNQAIDLIVSDELPYQSVKLLRALKDSIIAGVLRPFRGEMHSQKELIETEYPEGLSREQIITMSWLNDNIKGSIPSKEELVDSILTTALRSGV
ncbi:MAG: BMP family ABC transporter substrate-binding protein [Eubacteriales bacterium]|nr:BMP family ABC transporter substrate-binding protein [Eubacteriales bacterium]